MKQIWKDNIFIESWLIGTVCWIVWMDQSSHQELLNPQNPNYFAIAMVALYSLYIMLCIHFIRDGNYPVNRRWYLGRFIVLILARILTVDVLAFAIIPAYTKFLDPTSAFTLWVLVGLDLLAIPLLTLLIFCRNRIEKLKRLCALESRSAP